MANANVKMIHTQAQNSNNELAEQLMKTKKSFLPYVLVAVVALLIGVVVARQMAPSKEQVRQALYDACVNGSAYDPNNSNRQATGLACNRRSIDLSLATIYGDSYIDPMPDDQTRAHYESALNKYKRH